MKCDRCGDQIGTDPQSQCVSGLVPPEKREALAKDDRVLCGKCCTEEKREWAAVVDEFNPHEE